MQPSSMLNACGSGAHEPRADWLLTRCSHAPAASQIAESPRSLVDADHGGAREHGRKHTDDCHHAEELVASLLAAVLVQPPSAAAAAKSCGWAVRFDNQRQ